jgi:DNA-binding transcriptional ArsR family regulator
MKMKRQPDVARLALRLAALGAEPRLRIVRLLLAAHPAGLVVGDIQDALGIPGSTLSHHLEKLRHVDLVTVQREQQFLRYSANSDALREIMNFLYEECCTRSSAVEPQSLVQLGATSSGKNPD